MRNFVLSLVFLSFLTSCATVSEGKNQVVTVTTGRENDASCKLHNNQGDWIIQSTPGSANILRDYSELVIVCRKGSLKGVTSVDSHTKTLAYGNILVGGLIGAAVDTATGAAYDYPYQINVELEE